MLHQLGEAEIGDPWQRRLSTLALPFQHDVAGLQVAVQNTVVVGMLHGVGQGSYQFGRRPGGNQAGLLLEPGSQGRAATVRRGDVTDVARLAGLVNRYDIGVLQTGRGLGFAEERWRRSGDKKASRRGTLRATLRRSTGS